MDSGQTSAGSITGEADRSSRSKLAEAQGLGRSSIGVPSDAAPSEGPGKVR